MGVYQGYNMYIIVCENFLSSQRGFSIFAFHKHFVHIAQLDVQTNATLASFRRLKNTTQPRATEPPPRPNSPLQTSQTPPRIPPPYHSLKPPPSPLPHNKPPPQNTTCNLPHSTQKTWKSQCENLRTLPPHFSNSPSQRLQATAFELWHARRRPMLISEVRWEREREGVVWCGVVGFEYGNVLVVIL